MSGAFAALPVRSTRTAFVVVCLTFALLVTSALANATSVHASATKPSTGGASAANSDAVQLKAVFIVGPAGSQTSADLADAEQLALLAESYGMDVRRVFFPNATWDAVMSNIQGANLVYYAGHGYGWPSPYTKVLTESRQNGVGLNTFAGSSASQHTYYGADVIRANWVLAPNAIVFLNHDCYSAGNGEPGAAIPSWDVARQRVDNFAAGFLAVGARAVFAYSYQRLNKTLIGLLTTDQTMEQIFMTPGPKPTAYFGWIGADPRKFDSVRTAGAKNFMDPDPKTGFLRAITGELKMTAAEWAHGAPTESADPPNLSDLSAEAAPGPEFATPDARTFTPNGDGVTDSIALSYSVDREAFVDFVVRRDSGDAVRSFSAWTPGGVGTASWDGRNGAGSYVEDGEYGISATPRNRAGDTGQGDTVRVKVLTTMSAPKATPNLFYAADGDALASATILSVTLDELATFWWKIADTNGNVVRTFVNGAPTEPGQITFKWDGRDKAGEFVPDGTYYSVTTTATAAGMNAQTVPVTVGAFHATTSVLSPFVRGTKVKLFIQSAESLMSKPKVRVQVEGMAPTTFKTRLVAGGWMATITFAATGATGSVIFSVTGTDTGSQFQHTDYAYQLR
ncbi:MAG: FlgD immunoglobulin-like domain containing protein [Candidatus Limnocylindrales bacterium]